MSPQAWSTLAIVVVSFTATTRSQPSVVELVRAACRGTSPRCRATRLTKYSCPSTMPRSVPPLMTSTSGVPNTLRLTESWTPMIRECLRRDAADDGRRGAGHRDLNGRELVGSLRGRARRGKRADGGQYNRHGAKPSFLLRLVGCQGLQFGDPFLGVLQVLALLEFVHELLEVGERFGLALRSSRRTRRDRSRPRRGPVNSGSLLRSDEKRSIAPGYQRCR